MAGVSSLVPQILLMKDPGVIAEIYRATLVEAGLKPVILGQDRLDTVLSRSNISAAVVDVNIRNEHGLRFIRGIRRNKPDMGIIAMSAHFRNVPEFAEEVRVAGATICLSTPVEMQAVVAEIRAIINA